MGNSKLFLNGINIGSIKLGTSDVKMFLGSIKVYPIATTWDITAKFNVTDTSSPTKIGFNQYISAFTYIEIDGVVQPSVVSAYTFSTTGEHTVKYTLADPTTIGQGAFAGCTGLTSIDIPDRVTSIDDWVFSSCSSLSSITIPSSVTSIGQYAFQSCTSLTSINIPSGVTSIGQGAFVGCTGLTSIDIPDRVTSIGPGAFQRCTSLTNITIPSSVTSIGRYAFYNCTGLTSCTIGSGVTSIDDWVFSSCSSLSSITIPSSVTSIGQYAFYNCTSLTSITCNATTAPTIVAYTFEKVNTGGTLIVPSGSNGYDTWMQNTYYYLGYYRWRKVEQ